LIIARSGASTVAELTVLGRPSILVPLKQSLDGDQAANAASLASRGGALVLPQDQLITGAIKPLLHDLLQNPEVCAAMAASAKSQGRPDAALAAADQIERIAV
jgi:UDP-N-acetylglucosamine--N-acetylmuramyl-(pentapeptide) pyrophosphoryl-undecaprenol N-acetylglucosamine transferase